MHGNCLDHPLQNWFDFKIPDTSIKKTFIVDKLSAEMLQQIKPSSKLIWIGPDVVIRKTNNNENSKSLILNTQDGAIELTLDVDLADWLCSAISNLSSENSEIKTYEFLRDSFEKDFEDFTLFWYSEEMNLLREAGLLVL